MIRPLTLIFTLAALLMITQSSTAQQVTFDELVNSDNVEQASKSSSKKWIRDFYAANDVDAAKEVLKAEFLKLEKSRHWIAMYANGEITDELSFQTSKKMYVDRMIKDLKEAGFELASTRMSEESSTYVYANGNMKVEIYALVTETSAQQIYLVTLL